METNKQQLLDEIVRAQACIMRLNSKSLSYEDVKSLSDIGYGLFSLKTSLGYREVRKGDLTFIDLGIDKVNRYLDILAGRKSNLNEVYTRLTRIKGMLEKEIKA